MTTEPPRLPNTLSAPQILEALGMGCATVDAPRQRYRVLPGNSGPRWLIPEPSWLAAPVLSAWHPYGLTSRLKWFVLRAAAAAGLLRLAPSVSVVDTAREGSTRWLERCGMDSSGQIVILVGNPSADRKLIVFLLDSTRRICVVLKAGLSVRAGSSIFHEAEVLRKLEPYPWAPALLSVFPEQSAAAQQYVPGSMPDRRFRPEYLELLCCLPRSGASRNLTDVAAEMARRLTPFRAQCDQAAPGLLDRVLDLLNADIDVPTVLVHGDMTPWNLRKNDQAGYVLVDWEWADFAGLPAHDLLHFQFSNDRLFDAKSDGYSSICKRPVCAQYLRRMEIAPDRLPRLAAAYLLSQLEFHFLHRKTEDPTYLLRQLAAIFREPF